MALQGTFRDFIYTNHPTNTVTKTITYPEQMLEDDPDYDKRGTSEEVTVPETVEEIVEHENVYVVIQGTSVSVLSNNEDNKLVDLSCVYRVYTSKEDAKSNWEDYLFEGNVFGTWNWEEHTNPWEEAYNAIKNSPAGELLVDC